MGNEQQGKWTEEDQNKAAEKGQGAEIGGQHSKQTPDKASQGSSGGMKPSDSTDKG